MNTLSRSLELAIEARSDGRSAIVSARGIQVVVDTVANQCSGGLHVIRCRNLTPRITGSQQVSSPIGLETAIRITNDHARESVPFSQIGERTVTVEVTGVVRSSELSFEVRVSSEAGRPVVMTHWVKRSQRRHDCRNACAVGIRDGASAGSGASEPRSRIPTALAAQRRGISSYRCNGA